MKIKIRKFGIIDFQQSWDDMREFNNSRTKSTADEIWLLQHKPIYTQGTSCFDQPIDQPKRSSKNIPVVHTDRGGKMTYHAPGQLIVYILFDIKRCNTGPKSLVREMMRLVIAYLECYGVKGETRASAPGVYVDNAKIAALGLRISKGCCYHGLSININMDIEPFQHIAPCGFENLKITQLNQFVKGITCDQATDAFESLLQRHRWFP